MENTSKAFGTPAASAAKEPAEGVVHPEGTPTEDSAERKRADFEHLIRTEYKPEFDERVQKIIDRRFREMRVMKEQAVRMKPVLDALSEKYGANDAETLVKMLKADAPAEKRDDGRRIANAARQVMKWQGDAQAILRENPEFNLKNEMKNAAFTRLLKAGVDMKTAYRTLHQDEILERAVRYAAGKARDKTMKSMRMHTSRPEENGAGGRGGAKMAPMSVQNMTRAEREEIERRCARGEKVYFS